ncbi:MAG: cardiolipin synthase [Candidatus Hydrogenedentota bacterium]|nr:MAG: cardiolipin synthase [Candidatus Hydrogenedentota bacterium]
MATFAPIGILTVWAHVLVIVAVSSRIIMRRLPVNVSLVWLVLVYILPFVGAMFYLIFGEKRLGHRRAARALILRDRYTRWLEKLPQQVRTKHRRLTVQADALSRLAESGIGIPAMSGNRIELLAGADQILRAIIDDIDRAQHFCHMEFYIWNEGGTADEVCEALIRAAGRGVTCRLLLDALGSGRFFKGKVIRRLRKAGIQTALALPVGPLQMFFVRLDLRLHRKIVVIDNSVAYTGSFNLVDPRFFKQDAGVGEWIDAMARIKGPAVFLLGALFSLDWEMETGRDLDALPTSEALTSMDAVGETDVQVVPSGPGNAGENIQQLLLMAMYAARSELVLTTPYFVPDESILTAVLSAARRGVTVTLILPTRIDSRLVHYACRSFFDELLEAGVRICLFKGGLLHTKSLMVDREISIFGTVNLDIRSFWLDFEVSLCVFDPEFAARLYALQQRYIEKSETADPQDWRGRPAKERFIENLARLASPLL